MPDRLTMDSRPRRRSPAASGPRTIFVTQLVDPDDPVLGFATSWIEALHARSADLAVIANEVRSVPAALEGRVFSLGKEDGRGKVGRAVRYQKLLARLARQIDAQVLFVHMSPVYLNLAAPTAKAFGLRTMLWFAHPSITPALRIAERLTDAVVSSLPRAFPIQSPKVHVIGQAVDMRRFEPTPLPSRRAGLQVLAIGRTSPSKGFVTVLRAVARLLRDGIDVRLRVVGPSTTATEVAHRRELEHAVEELGVGGAVALLPPVRPVEMPGLLSTSHVLANAMVAGSGDKVVFETMAAGRIPVASNPSMASLLEDIPLNLRFDEHDDRQLASRLAAIAKADGSLLQRVSDELRHRVAEGHSLDRWADRVITLALSESLT